MMSKGALFKLTSTFRAALICSVLVMAGCGVDKDDLSASLTAAKVNRSEITVHQINLTLQQQRVPPAQAEAAGKDVLERLINQELTLQRAKELKLERDATVLQQIDAAQREILARAYIDRIVSSVQQPTAAEVRQYYERNPALFKERKIYNFREFNIVADPSELDGLKVSLSSAKNVNSFTELLKSQGMVFSSVKISKSVEELPMADIETFVNLQEGQTVVNATASGFQVRVLLSTQNQPLSEDQAHSSIENFIFQEKKRKLIEADLRSLRENSSIEYIGDYKKIK